MQKNYTYLALGDSYTIGESLPLTNSFPYQVCQFLRKKSIQVNAPEIIAKTGWTTDELSAAITDYEFLEHYSFVSLLIGVNNQYRGRPVEEYKIEFESLLKKAIQLANNKSEHVIVISIPDYSITPFADALDKEKISKEIDLYNSVNRAVSIQYKVHYIDITLGSRRIKKVEKYIADDKLHPSEKVYKKWAEEVVEIIKPALK